jgi:hypothetical protein
MKSAWDRDATMGERLTQWRGEGIPFSVIAVRLRISRNSCIGWARRNNVKGTTSHNPRPQRAVASPSPLPTPELPMLKPEPDEPVAPPVRLLETVGWKQCRYPVDGPEPMCCGAPTAKGTSWCVNHLRVCFALVSKRQRAA